MECYLCGSKKNVKRKGHPRDNKLISILECSECGLVFLDNFDHIDENFYHELIKSISEVAIEANFMDELNEVIDTLAQSDEIIKISNNR